MENPSVKNGILGAGVAIILSVISWFLGIGYYIILGFILGFLVIIYFMYRSGKEARDLNGGFIEFGEIFKYLMLTFVILSFITSVFQYIMVNFIDTNLMANMNDTMKDFFISRMPAEASEEAREQLEDKFAEAPTTLELWPALWGWVKGLIMGAIIAAIMSAIMKKKNPEMNDFA